MALILLAGCLAGAAARTVPPPTGWDQPVLQGVDPFTTFTASWF